MGHLGFDALVVWLVLNVAVFVGVPIVIFLFARRLLRAIERRSDRKSETAELTERLQRMEERMYELTSENDRLREGQRFTNELLLERSSEAQSPPRGAS